MGDEIRLVRLVKSNHSLSEEENEQKPTNKNKTYFCRITTQRLCLLVAAFYISVTLLTIGTTIITVYAMRLTTSGNDQLYSANMQHGEAKAIFQHKNKEHDQNGTLIFTNQKNDEINSEKEENDAKGHFGGKESEGENGPLGDKGPQGDAGPQGKKGQQGNKGQTGDTGISGEKGLKGDMGQIGEEGLKGEKGPKGEQGTIGDKGHNGDKGSVGDKGQVGDKGPVGEKGPFGDKGSRGEKGMKGQMGEDGIIGIQGSPGSNGTDGEKGLRGEKGSPGKKGLQGERGLKGETGIRGKKGLVGESGEKGTKGELGSTGMPGIKGIRGDKGPTGDKGEQASDRSCGAEWELFGKYCYHFKKSKVTWKNAKTECQRLGGNLVKIENSVENWFLKSMSKEMNIGSMWLGASDLDKEGEIVWVSDQSTVRNGFSDWLPGEPNNGGRREDCVMLWSARAYKWNDSMCSEKFGFICKK